MYDEQIIMRTLGFKLTLLLLILGFLLAGVVWVMRNAEPGNPPIVFSDGTSLRLLDVTEGTNHVYGSTLVKVLNKLPKGVAQPLLKRLPNGGRLNRRTTSRSTLVVWVEHTRSGAGARKRRIVMLRSPAGLTSGRKSNLSLWTPPGTTRSVHPLEFPCWPRRDQHIECVIYERDQDHDIIEIGSFRFRNPGIFEGTDWTPDPTSTTRNSGDLEVTLLDFAAGLESSTTHKPGPDGRNTTIHHPASGPDTHAMVRVAVNSPRGTNEQWAMFNADLSDATGNELTATSRSGMTSIMVFSPLLWTDEPAWKIKLHLKRKTGFAPEELLTLSNIALPKVGATNVINQTNAVMGIETVLRSFIRRPDLINADSWSSSDLSEFRVDHTALGKTNQLDLLSIVAQPAGTLLNTGGSSWSDTYHEFSIKHIPTNTTHLDLTFSVQKARFVEFTVAPNWMTNDYVVETR